jgi:C4-dicarboxylate-specific signal transduction histidine kinase
MKIAELPEDEIFGISMQISEFEERYRELLRINLSARLGELTASLTHELTQPLAAILSNAQAGLRFLASGKNDPDLFRRILEDIVQDDKRAADVIRGLRSLMKREKPRKNPANVNDLLDAVIVIIRSELSTRDIMIETHYDETLPSAIVDKTQIQQVLLNLIMNAADAVAQDPRGKRRVILRTEKSDGFVHVVVHDTGPGITAEDASRIFEPFYSTKSDGLGMGLTICRSIITDHKGRIWAENNPEGGATFSFALPMNN